MKITNYAAKHIHTQYYIQGKHFPTTQRVPVGTYGIQNTFNLYELMKTLKQIYTNKPRKVTVESETVKKVSI